MGHQPRRQLRRRQGYPFPQAILSPNRANGAGKIQVQLDPLGDVRFDNLQRLTPCRQGVPFRRGHGGAGDGPVQR